MSLWDWPAMRGVNRRPQSTFIFRRAAYSKVDNASTGYRWISASEGFTNSRKEIQERVRLVSQEKSGISLWWNFDRRHYASFSAFSRGRDSEARPYTETQILEWTAGDTPAILGALALLPQVSGLIDADFSSLASNPAAKADGFELRLPEFEIRLDAEELEKRVEAGLDDLRRFPKDVLRDFYLALISGAKPAVLTGSSQPMKPEAVAALLLPATPGETASWSVAGWPTDYAGWSGIAGPWPRRPGPDVASRDLRDRATFMAAAIYENDPKVAYCPCDNVRTMLQFARNANERYFSDSRLPQRSAQITAAEAALLEEALKEVLYAEIPDYLRAADEHVQTAYQLHMETKAEVVKALWFICAPPKEANAWLSKFPSKGELKISRVLKEWQENPLANAASRYLEQAATNADSSEPI